MGVRKPPFWRTDLRPCSPDASKTPLHASSKAETNKRTENKKRKVPGDPDEYVFLPFAVETTGALGAQAKLSLKCLARNALISDASLPTKTISMNTMITWVSFAVARGNALLLSKATGRLRHYKNKRQKDKLKIKIHAQHLSSAQQAQHAHPDLVQGAGLDAAAGSQ